MYKQLLRQSSRKFFAAGILLGGFASSAWAVDGVILINQSSALAGNVTPGDLPGFPVTISQSGSYRLAGNLTVPDANTTAIEVTATGQVTVDLNGFVISGPGGSVGTGVGVHNATRVLNGGVVGMGAEGVIAEQVEDVYVSQNGETGVKCVICLRIRATKNRTYGILLYGIPNGITNPEGPVVRDSVVSENGQTGIQSVGNGVVVAHCTATGNVGAGIYLTNGTVTASAAINNAIGIIAYQSTVSDSNASGNSSQGIYAQNSRITGNVANENGEAGIEVSGGNVMGNYAEGNGGFGLLLNSATLITGPVGYGNNVFSANAGGSVSGPRGIVIAPNVCGTAAC